MIPAPAPVYRGDKWAGRRSDLRAGTYGHGRCEIRVLDENWNVVETISNEDLKPVV
jgi:hypothetical protein